MPLLLIPQIEALRDNPPLYEALKKLTAGINTVAQASSVEDVGPPNRISRLSVTAADGIFDIAITDPSAASAHGILYYFVESCAEVGFTRPMVYFLGPTRNARLMLGNQTLYWRAYSQFPGSGASPYVYFGSPTAVVGGGPAGPAPQPPHGGGWKPGCSEVGTALRFFSGANPQMVVEPCSDWVEIDLEDGHRVNFARGTLVSVFIPVEKLARGALVETEQGSFSPLRRKRRSRRKSWKQKVTEPVHQTYLANGVRSHNMKPMPDPIE